MRNWIVKVFLASLIFGVMLGIVGCAQWEQRRLAQRIAFDDPALDVVTNTSLETFKDEAEFRAYLAQIKTLRDQRQSELPKRAAPGLLAQNDTPCTPNIDCPEEDGEGLSEVTVTGSRIAAPVSASITNNQSVGVDEGDVVKQIGDYLLILQDGRVFAVNATDMRLTDRIDVYRPRDSSVPKRNRWDSDFEGADWYDEMLVYHQFVIITAYSYDHEATEVSILELNQNTGGLTRKHVFWIDSLDYYSARNYAARLVGDDLVLRTSAELSELPEKMPQITQAYPKIADAVPGALLEPKQIYKPVLRTAEPYLHQLTRCSLAPLLQGKPMACTALALIGPEASELYVSPQFVYLWLTAGDSNYVDSTCEELGFDPRRRAEIEHVPPAAIYRIALADNSLTVASARGWIADQFNIDEFESSVRALVLWTQGSCYFDQEYPTDLSYLRLTKSDFLTHYAHHEDTMAWTPVPSIAVGLPRARFVDRWLVYGGTTASYPPKADEDARSDAKLYAVHERHPAQPRQLDLKHDAIRIERLGQNALITGYHDAKGLSVSVVKLGQGSSQRARVQDSLLVENRFESEGRSHAFNYTIEQDQITMGIPTVMRRADADRYSWYSETSDLSYLRLQSGQLKSLGVVAAAATQQESNVQGSYECEVSCIDWYGNARPIFTAKAWYGLMGTELVEVVSTNKGVQMRRRLDLTAKPGTGFESQ